MESPSFSGVDLCVYHVRERTKVKSKVNSSPHTVQHFILSQQYSPQGWSVESFLTQINQRGDSVVGTIASQ